MHPGGNGLFVSRGPAAPVFGQIDQLAGFGANALEVAFHFFLAAVGHAPLFLLAAVEGHHHVVLLATAQWVVHQVALGAGPQAGGVPLQVVGEVGLVNHGTVHHMTGHAGWVVHVLRAHHALATVSANQRLAGPAFAVLVDGRDDFGGFVLFDFFDAGAGEKLDLAGFLRAFEQRQVDVHTVDHGIGVAETLAEGFAGFQAAHQGFVGGVVHHHAVGVHRAPTGLVAHAQRVERVERVGSQLDARTDFADFGCLFKHLNLEALANQSQRGGQPANAAAGDQNRQI